MLLTDTLRGYSSAAPAGKPGEYGMEYSDTYFSIFQTLTRFRESGRPDDVIITSSFTNPINAETSIAFVTQIETRDESGAAASAFLLYVEPLRALQEVWTAFSEKENAQMSMINTMGDDTYRASMLKNENFYEYLISYNDLTYPQVEALRDTIRTAEEPGWIEYLNSKGQETLYAYSTDSQWGWTLIASIEMKELQGGLGPVDHPHRQRLYLWDAVSGQFGLFPLPQPAAAQQSHPAGGGQLRQDAVFVLCEPRHPHPP